MPDMVAELAPLSQLKGSRLGGLASNIALRYGAGMATRAKKPQRGQGNRPTRPMREPALVIPAHARKVPDLYVREHLAAKHLEVVRLAQLLGMHEKAVSKALSKPSRIWKSIGAWAYAIGLEDWRDLTRPPGKPSVDARIDALPDEFQKTILRSIGKG